MKVSADEDIRLTLHIAKKCKRGSAGFYCLLPAAALPKGFIGTDPLRLVAGATQRLVLCQSTSVRSPGIICGPLYLELTEEAMERGVIGYDAE